jgi:hypothetical protein
MLSAESKEFSTSSRIVVYRHFPGYTINKTIESVPYATGKKRSKSTHIIKPSNILVIGEKLCWTLLLQRFFLITSTLLRYHPFSV